MPPSIEAIVRGSLLRWARETSGLSTDKVARKLKLPPERIAGWEHDLRHPTVAQLRKLADVYKRPLAAFYLPAVPSVPSPPHDFRKMSGSTGGGDMSPELLLELRRARFRRGVALELYEETGTDVRVPLPSVALSSDADRVAVAARDLLRVSIETQALWRDDYTALRNWIGAVERLGVLVFQTGNVPLREMRGFSLGAERLPAIVLNAKDRPRARMFTLLHEFAHLLLRSEGVCDPLRVARAASTRDDRVEVFCNRVAGAVLVPRAALLANDIVSRSSGVRDWSAEEIRDIADEFTVSRDVVLRRLLIEGRISVAAFDIEHKRLQDIYAKMAAPKSGPKRKIVIPPFRKAIRNNGLRYTRLVLDAFDSARIGPSAVVQYLGAKFQHVDAIKEAARAGIGSEGD